MTGFKHLDQAMGNLPLRSGAAQEGMAWHFPAKGTASFDAECIAQAAEAQLWFHLLDDRTEALWRLRDLFPQMPAPESPAQAILADALHMLRHMALRLDAAGASWTEGEADRHASTVSEGVR